MPNKKKRNLKWAWAEQEGGTDERELNFVSMSRRSAMSSPRSTLSGPALHESYRDLLSENTEMAAELRRAREVVAQQAKILANVPPRADLDAQGVDQSPGAPVTAQLMFANAAEPRVIEPVIIHTTPHSKGEFSEQAHREHQLTMMQNLHHQQDQPTYTESEQRIGSAPSIPLSPAGCLLCQGNAELVESLRRELERVENLNSQLNEDLRLRNREYLALLAEHESLSQNSSESVHGLEYLKTQVDAYQSEVKRKNDDGTDFDAFLL